MIARVGHILRSIKARSFNYATQTMEQNKNTHKQDARACVKNGLCASKKPDSKTNTREVHCVRALRACVLIALARDDCV